LAGRWLEAVHSAPRHRRSAVADGATAVIDQDASVSDRALSPWWYARLAVRKNPLLFGIVPLGSAIPDDLPLYYLRSVVIRAHITVAGVELAAAVV
jgi:hypothetical protein